MFIGCIFPTLSFAQRDKIDQAVLDAVETQETVAVIIYLQEQPNLEISPVVKAQFAPNIDAKADSIRNKINPFLQQGQPLPVNIKAEVKALHEDIDRETSQMRGQIYTQIWNRVSAGQGRVRQAIENAGGTVHAQTAVTNSIGAKVPALSMVQIAGLADVRSIEIASEAVPELAVSVPTTQVNSQWNAGYTGGTYDIGIVEWGVAEHPNLRSIASGKLIRRRDEPGSAHGTQVAGVAASTHSTRKGVAFGLEKFFDAYFGNPPNEPEVTIDEPMEWAVTYSPDSADVLNLSVAVRVDGEIRMAQGSPDYSSHGAAVDSVIDTYAVIATKAAGNGGPASYTLTYPADAYNAIVVAASDDKGTSLRSDDDLMDNPNSSRGPTPSGRKKPDLTAPGEGIHSTSLNSGWATDSGTSYAAPHVAGAVLLARDHAIWRPYLIKAWLINSADDKGSTGWDNGWGWGYMNLSTAQDIVGYVQSNSLTQGGSKWYSGTMRSGDKATLVWHKHLNQSLSNLNLYLYNSSGTLLTSSASTIDNVEQVVLNSGSNISVYLRVVYANGFGTEEFGLSPSRDLDLTSAPSWASGAPAAVSLDDEADSPALYNNYPNPSNPETWIPYHLASNTDVQILIYDTKGELVRQLDLGHQKAGDYTDRSRSAYWDGRNEHGESVASGVYFYTLKTNDYTETRKMLILK